MKLSEAREDANLPQYSFDGPVAFSRHFSPAIGLFVGSKEERPDPKADMDHSKEVKAMISKGTDSKQAPPPAATQKVSPAESARQHAYSTWKVHLKGIPKFFGDTHQHWLESYPNAQKIFEGPKIVRASIRSAHRILYARSTMNEFGLIKNADDFWRELAPQERATDDASLSSNPTRHEDPNTHPLWRVKPALYTYIIGNDDMLRFSETGAAFLADFASKHALHSGCAETVRYSGEFHARPLVEGGWAGLVRHAESDRVEWELLIDNASGTYGPNKELLPKLKETFEHNFEGIRVLALDFKDDELKRSKEELSAYAKGRDEAEKKVQSEEGNSQGGSDKTEEKADDPGRNGKGDDHPSDEKGDADKENADER